LQDLYLRQVTPRQLDFISPFSLVSTTEHRQRVSAFVVYFDTFFNVTGDPVPPETTVNVIKPNEPTLAEVWPVGGKRPPQRRKSSIFRETEKVTSFSTGPQSIPTHWKQTLFLLREPITVVEGMYRRLQANVYPSLFSTPT
jgi:protein arginine N-methyltransferase 3